MSKIQAVKKDMIILEKSEFSALLTENEVNVCFSFCLFFNQMFLILIIYFSQKLKIHLLQLKVQLTVGTFNDSKVEIADFFTLIIKRLWCLFVFLPAGRDE